MYQLKTYLPLIILFFLSALVSISCNSNTDNRPAAQTEEGAVSEQSEITAPGEETPSEGHEERPEKEVVFTFGIDISKYQGDEVTMLDKHKDALSFIICKATEGVTYTDPDFSRNWKTIPEKGFIRGAYHFYQSSDDPKNQVSNYLNVIAELQANDLPPIVDFEEGGIDPSQPLRLIQSNLYLFLKEVEDKSGRKPIIYTNSSTGNKYLDNPRFAKYALWIANYDGNDQPQVPTTWKDAGWVFWQKSSSYDINGTENDFDLFNGSLAELQQFISEH